MFCSNCGTQLADNTNFCNNCGARQAVAASATAEQPTAATATESVMRPVTPEVPIEKVKKKTTKMKIGDIGLDFGLTNNSLL